MRTQRERIAATRWAVLGCGATVAALGAAVLVGWTSGRAGLTAMAPGMATMKANTALGLCASGLALILRARRGEAPHARRAAASALALIAASIGLLTLLEYVADVSLGLDQLLFHERAGAVATDSPGRMAVVSALTLTLGALSLALVERGPAALQQLLAAVMALIALSGLLSYAYGTAVTTSPAGTTEPSLPTMAASLVLSVGLLLARPRESGVGVVLGDTSGALICRSMLAAGLVLAPILGALRLVGQHAGLYGSSDGVVLMVIASLVALLASTAITSRRLNALERQRSAAVEQLAASERRRRVTLEQLVEVQERERRRLAGDLHDDAVPALAAIGLQLELARGRAQDRDVCERLQRAEADLRAAATRLRHVMFDLMPETLTKQGLGVALRSRLEQMRELSGVEYQLHDRIGMKASSEAAATLYRVALEALRNVERHAQARHVHVELSRRDAVVQVTIADDGIGLGTAVAAPGHFGLRMMRERAWLTGGGVTISSVPGGGTTVLVWVPHDAPPRLEPHSISPPRIALATAAARSETSSLS